MDPREPQAPGGAPAEATASRAKARAAKAAPRVWDGGYIRKDARGRDVYVIRRQVGGRRYVVSTRAHSAKAAFEQLRRFEADPDSYTPSGTSGKPPLPLDATLVAGFLAHSRDSKRNSREWREKQKRMLADWAEDLAGLDLRAGKGARQVSLVRDILPALERRKSSRTHRIAILKALYAYLRKELHVLGPGEDPTFETLTVPQARPEQWRREKTIPREDYLKAREHLEQHWRDGLDLQAGTGWHTSELMRFAKDGRVEPYRGEDAGVAGVLVCPQTKSGEPLRTAVSAEVRAAAERLLARGVFGRKKYGIAVNAACKAADVTPFTPGRFRHSVATWAIEKGADPASVAAFLNHKSVATTRKFYATHAVPKKVPTLL